MVTGPVAVDVDTHAGIHAKVHQKVSRYGELALPYVLALQLRTSMPATAFEIDRALYGTEHHHWSQATGEYLGRSRSQNGVFTSKDADGNPIRTRLSAILFYNQRILPGEDASRHEVAIYHHQFAARPLGTDLFGTTPQKMIDDLGGGKRRHRWIGEPPDWAM